MDSIIAWQPWPPTSLIDIDYLNAGMYTAMLVDSSFCGRDTAYVDIIISGPPSIAGVIEDDQLINDRITIAPFSTILITEPNEDNVSVTITLDDNAKGVLSGTGLSGNGPYTLASTDAVAIQTSLRALSFDPTDNRVSMGASETTVFTLEVSDGSLNNMDSRTTVVSSRLIDISISGNPSNTATSVDFAVTFSEAVTGVDLSDFSLDQSIGVMANLEGINGSTTDYTVTVNGIEGQGTISIDLNDINTGIAADGIPIIGGFTNSAAHSVGDAYDVSKAVYSGSEDLFSVVSQEDGARSLAFNQEGTKMFVMGLIGDDINEYNLSNGFDVSTAVYAGDAERFSVAAQETFPFSMSFNHDGTKMFVMGTIGNDVSEYALSAAYDISTADYMGDAESFNVSSQESAPFSVTFNRDGSKMFIVGGGGMDINEYQLAVTYDVSSAAYAGDAERLDVSVQETVPTSMTFNGNGTKMFVTGINGMDINEYLLSIPYDVSTATFAGDEERFSLSNQDEAPFSHVFNNDGTKMYMIGTSDASIHEYSLAEPVITGALVDQAVEDQSTINPFATIIVADPNEDNLSAIITLDDYDKGILSGTELSGTGPYVLTSTDATSLQTSLRALVFDPEDHRVSMGGSEITSFTLELSDGLFNDVDDRTTVVSSPAETATLSISAVTQAMEDDSDGLFMINCSSKPNAAITVNISVTGTAISGIDYDDLGMSFVFPENTLSITIPLSVLPDDLIDPDETIIVTLTDTDNDDVTIGSMNAATITIADDEVSSFILSNNPSVLEDVGAQNIMNWVTDISSNPLGSLAFNVSNDNPDLFSAQPAVDPDGTLSYTPAINAYGVANLTVNLMVDETVPATAQTATLTITPVNDPPSFTVDDQNFSTNVETRDYIVENWATDIKSGPTNEINQQISFGVENDNTPLFDTQPAIDEDGNLTFSIAEGQSGEAIVLVNLSDDGGVTNGGEDTSDTLQFTIKVVESDDQAFLPSLFTPNNDGKNDRFIIRGGSGAQAIKLSVIDRNSNVVFESTDWEELSQQGWDGTSGGKEQPSGAYIWVLKGKLEDGTPFRINGKEIGVIRISR